MPITIDNLSRLNSHIFAAAADPARWTDFMDEISKIGGDIAAHMIGFDFETNSHVGHVTSGYDDYYTDNYQEYYFGVNPWATTWLNSEVGRVMAAEDMCSRDELENSEFYNDWVVPQEDIVGGGGVLVFREKTRLVALGGNIRRKNVDLLETDWLKLIELITPQLRHAFDINRTLRGMSFENSALATTNSLDDPALLIISQNKKLIYANSKAEQYLDRGDIIRESHSHTVYFCDRTAEDNLCMSLNSLNHKDTSANYTFPTNSRNQGPHLVCRTACILPDNRFGSPFGPLVGEPQPCIFLTIAPREASKDVTPTLMSRFGLTPREARIAIHIAGGLTPREIAEMDRVSIHTVRAQLRSVMSKLDVRRQADMVRSILSL